MLNHDATRKTQLRCSNDARSEELCALYVTRVCIKCMSKKFFISKKTISYFFTGYFMSKFVYLNYGSCGDVSRHLEHDGG